MGKSHENAAWAFTYLLLLVFPLFPLIRNYIDFFLSYIMLRIGLLFWYCLSFDMYRMRKLKYNIIPNQRGLQKSNNFLVCVHVLKKMLCIVLLFLLFIQYIALENENIVAFRINKYEKKI